MNGSRLLFTFSKKQHSLHLPTPRATSHVSRLEATPDALVCCIDAMNDVDHPAPRSSTVKTNKEWHYRSSRTTFVQALWQLQATRPSSQLLEKERRHLA